jgi:hypothetical protein
MNSAESGTSNEKIKTYAVGCVVGVVVTFLSLFGLGVHLATPYSYSDAVMVSNRGYLKDVNRIACLPGEVGEIIGGAHNFEAGRYVTGWEYDGHSGFLQVSCYKVDTKGNLKP